MERGRVGKWGRSVEERGGAWRGGEEREGAREAGRTRLRHAPCQPSTPEPRPPSRHSLGSTAAGALTTVHCSSRSSRRGARSGSAAASAPSTSSSAAWRDTENEKAGVILWDRECNAGVIRQKQAW